MLLVPSMSSATPKLRRHQWVFVSRAAHRSFAVLLFCFQWFHTLTIHNDITSIMFFSFKQFWSLFAAYLEPRNCFASSSKCCSYFFPSSSAGYAPVSLGLCSILCVRWLACMCGKMVYFINFVAHFLFLFQQILGRCFVFHVTALTYAHTSERRKENSAQIA